jgi:superfamily II DNA or RNA helicase
MQHFDREGRAFSRDRAAEAEVRFLLESFGAIELDLLEDHGVPPDCDADYLVQLEGDHHGHCAFTAYALPQLRALGWDVHVDGDYPYQIVTQEPPWYAVVEALEDQDAAAEESDWFSLELGIEVDGHRVNLLPALLDMLDGAGQLELAGLERRAPRFVELPHQNRYVEVPAERYRTLLRVLAELYQGEGEGEALRFPAVRAVALAELDDVLSEGATPVHWEGGEDVRARGRAMSRGASATEPLPAPPAVNELQATLRPYQEHGLAWLQRLREQSAGAVLADDMGLGKTLQTIAHLCLEVQSGRAQAPSLIVAPTSLVGNWRRELSKFAPHLEVVVFFGRGRSAVQEDVPYADVVITSYSVLLRDDDFLLSQQFHCVVLDEAQAIKNPRSRASQLAKGLDGVQRIALSGTPIENSLTELWSLFDFSNPGLLGSEEQFRHFYRIPIEQVRDENRLETLRATVAPYVLRRMKEQVATELPPKTEVVRPVELRGKQRELYESIRVAAHSQVRQAIRKKGFAASTLTILDALMKLRQLCCDPRLVRGDAARFVRESAKFELLMQLLESQLADGRRALVFSQFTSMLSLIGQGLSDRRIGYASLTGSTTNRDRPVRAFENGDVDVFLISLKAGGTGLNLVSADTVIHYDPWWNPAAQDQATDRAYRIGQKKPVFVYNLIVAGSVEERMLALQQKKRKLAESVIGRGKGEVGKLGEAEVEHLLSPLDD